MESSSLNHRSEPSVLSNINLFLDKTDQFLYPNLPRFVALVALVLIIVVRIVANISFSDDHSSQHPI